MSLLRVCSALRTSCVRSNVRFSSCCQHSHKMPRMKIHIERMNSTHPALSSMHSVGARLTELQFSMGIFARRMSSSKNYSDSEPQSPSRFHAFFQSIYEKMSQSIQNEVNIIMHTIHRLSFAESSDMMLRLSAFIGVLHATTEYGFKTYTCEGPSMEPTIIDGSFTTVLIERWSHRLHGLETDYDMDLGMYETGSVVEPINSEVEPDFFQHMKQKWLPVLRGIWKQHFTSGLQRGDVIILNHPTRDGTICKRIIGMPGDVIVQTDEESHNYVAVPPGHLWIEGDNPRESLDSRSYGAVPASLTIGKVICRLWPLRDYAWVGADANGMHQWKRIDGRIGRGIRPMPEDGSRFLGSHVLGMQR